LCDGIAYIADWGLVPASTALYLKKFLKFAKDSEIYRLKRLKKTNSNCGEITNRHNSMEIRQNMKVKLTFVPPGGGEADYSLDFNLPSVPNPGDYIVVSRPNRVGTEDFKVRRTWWDLEYPNISVQANEKKSGKVRRIVVECEFAISSSSSPEHKLSVDRYAEKKGGKINEFDATAY
jgi:hypothetical protein